MNEPGICPLCNALQNPDTGNCLICGKHYHLLDIPTSETDNCIPSDFLVRLPNGFLTFKALVEMALSETQNQHFYTMKKKQHTLFTMRQK